MYSSIDKTIGGIAKQSESYNDARGRCRQQFGNQENTSLLESSRVDHRRSIGFGAEHDQQIANHGSLLVFIKLDDVL